MNEPELVRLLGAILALLLASQVVGAVFQRLRQPRVVGEILGGLLLGPTVLGALAPALYAGLFEPTPAHQQILGFVFWLGLILLMFCSGLETPTVKSGAEWRSVGWLTAAGTILPLLAGWGLAVGFDFSPYFGPHATPVSFGLVLALAIAVTSIPVISKIFLDLGLAGTPFARVVLSAAMIEDIVLWVLLSLALGMASVASGDPAQLALGVAVPVAYFAGGLLVGPRLYDAIARRLPLAHFHEGAPAVVVLLAAVLAAALLSVNPIFGAFLAGRIVAQATTIPDASRQAIKGFSLAFFVPIYFASVGLKLNLLSQFPLLTFLALLVAACAIKAAAAFLGGMLAGQQRAQSLHLAVAMNARGGPGIVLATVTLEAGLINEGFYAVLIMLALVTSQLAGWWLERVLRQAPEELELAA